MIIALFHLVIRLWTLFHPFLDFGQALHGLLEATDLRELVHTVTQSHKGYHVSDHQRHRKVRIRHLQMVLEETRSSACCVQCS